MTISLKHSFQSLKADGTDSSLVQPSNWNAEHQLTLASGKLVGRTTAGTGAAEEISVGGSLTFSGGVLSIDTSALAPLASPALTGTPTAPTAAVSTNTTQLATTAYVMAQIANDAPTKTGTGATGTWGISISGNAATATTATTATSATNVTGSGATATFSSAQQFDVRSASGQTTSTLRIMDGSSNIRCQIQGNASNEFTVLNSSGTVTLRVDSSGNLTATANLTAYSDERLKTNVATIESAVSLVQKMRGVRFERTDAPGRPQIGVIAQEIAQVTPEVVVTDADGMLSVAYGNLVGVLIEAVKELADNVQYLKEREFAREQGSV